MESFMTRSGHAELAKQTNAIGASVSTVFLFVRLWSRSTQYNGLWLDDYLLTAAWAFQLVGNSLSAAAPAWGFHIHNSAAHGWTFVFGSLTFWYLSMALAKTAFAATLIRLSGRRLKVIMWILVLVVWAFSLTLTVVTWLNICEQRVDASLTETCVPFDTIIWIHTGNAIATIVIDVALACLPWQVLSTIYIPKKEKWGVAVSMSLTGCAAIICIVRSYFMSYSGKLDSKGLDYSYGAFVCYGLCQAEITVYIVAQTAPLLRVLYLSRRSKSKSTLSRLVTSVAEIEPDTDRPKVNTRGDISSEPHASIELVQLPTGRIVAADSEEGKEFTASQAGSSPQPGPSPQQEGITVAGAETTQRREGAQSASAIAVPDAIHDMWAGMGLSRRAWSLSPATSPEQEATHRRQISTDINLVGSA